MRKGISLLILLATFLAFSNGCNQNNREKIIAKGIEYAKQGNYDEAIVEFSKAITINHNDFEAYNRRAGVYAVKGNTKQALSDLSKAIEINPTYEVAYLNRAVRYFMQKEYDKAWKDVHKIESLGGEINPVFLGELKKLSGKDK